MVKGFKDKNKKFHPLTQSKGVRMSRDQSTKQKGVLIRKARDNAKKSSVNSVPESVLFRVLGSEDIPRDIGHKIWSRAISLTQHRDNQLDLQRKGKTGKFSVTDAELEQITKNPDEKTDEELRESIRKARDGAPEPVLETQLTDIMEEIGNMKSGDIDFTKLDKVIEDNIKFILKREKRLGKDESISINHVATRPETGEDEFKKTGTGDTGSYQYDFTIWKNGDRTPFSGTAFGSISMGDILDMELELYDERKS